MELMFFSIIILFILSSNFCVELIRSQGQIFTLIIATTIGAETALGLGLLIICFRNKKKFNVINYNFLKG